MIPLAQRIVDATAVYRDRRMLVLTGLGFSSGLPILLVYSTLSLWMADIGISLRTIGFASTVLVPYKLKFIWAPLVDRIPIPGLGLRRGWLLLTQMGLVITIIGIGTSDPRLDLYGSLGWAVALGIISATHDIVVDGYRVELLEPEDQGAGAAVAVFGYRIAMIVAGAGAIYVAHFFGWQIAYFSMAFFVLIGVVAALCAEEPEGSLERLARKPNESTTHFLGRSFKEGAIGPFVDMVTRRGFLLFMSFIMLFTLGESLLGTMTNPFMIQTGFTKLEIANIVKTFGIVATIFGIFVGGAMVRSLGVIRALWIGGLGQMFLNLAFSVQAIVGHDVWVLAINIFLEKFTYGLAAAAFVAYLSALCSRSFGATHYALLMSASGLVKVALAAPSGIAVEGLKLWMGDAKYYVSVLIERFREENLTDFMFDVSLGVYHDYAAPLAETVAQSDLSSFALSLSPSSALTADAKGWALYFLATTIIAAPGMILLYYLNKWNMTGLTGSASQSTDPVAETK